MSQTLTLRLESYDKDAQRLVAAAQTLADERKHAEVEPLHLFFRLLERSDATHAAVRRAGVDPTDVLVEAEAQLRKIPKVAGSVAYLSTRLLDLLTRGEGEAARTRSSVSVAHLFLACAQESSGGIASVLRTCGLSGAVLRATFAEELSPSSTPSGNGVSALPRTGADPLAEWGIDLVAQAERGELDPVIGRDDELRRMMQILARRFENNPLLVGESGIGKHSIVRAFAQRIASGDVPSLFEGKRIVEIDLGLLSAGTKLRSEADERMRALLAAARDSAGQVILFLPDLAQLVGDKSNQGPGQLLSSALGRGEVRGIALASPEGAKKAEDADKLLLSRFAPIAIEPPNTDEAIEIVRGIVGRYESAHGVTISDQAIVGAVRLAKRYVPSATLPKAAIDLLDEAAARVRVEQGAAPPKLEGMRRRLALLLAQLESLVDDPEEDAKRTHGKLDAEASALKPQLETAQKAWQTSREATAGLAGIEIELNAARAARDAAAAAGDNAKAGELRFGTIPLLEKQLETAREAAADQPAIRNRVMESDVADVVAAWTGVPVSRMMQEETEKLLQMETRLRDRVVGQDPALEAVSRAVRRGRVGLRDPKRPIGSFLFLGPTGVGKTELAKALAEFLFDDESSLTRLDMSEFMEKHSVARLLGSPPGYVDSEEGGFLTEAVRKRPYSVILFDEMEKAHPDVFNILLQVLDDGRLTDSRGRLAHFADTVIIMTSNVGSGSILDHGEGVTREQIRAQLDSELRKHFRPEFLNRIDDTVIFDPLSKIDLRGIVEIQLRLLSRMVAERGVRLEVTDAAKDRLVELGYEPAFGARPVKRVILKNLQDPLAEEMLKGGYVPGDVVRVDATADAFTFGHERDKAQA
jgi:ATP-dependent Clp protease ATP-binding subunit ClpB